jgi:hypothetical protein
MYSTYIALQAVVCGLLAIVWDLAYAAFITKTIGVGENDRRAFTLSRIESMLHSISLTILLQRLPLQEVAFWCVFAVGLMLLYHQLITIRSYLSTATHIKKLFLIVIKKRKPQAFDWFMSLNVVYMVTFAMLSVWELHLIWQAVSLGRPI